MSSPSRKKTRTSAGDAMKLVAKPEPALTYAARDSFAFRETEGPAEPVTAAALPEPPVLPALPEPPVRRALPAPAAAAPFAASAALATPLAQLSSANVEAVARAGAIVAQGLEEIGQSVLALGQRHLESSLTLAKAAIGTTSLRQLVDLQTSHAKDSFDRLVAEGRKMQEISLKTANAALQPLQARMAAAIDTLARKAA